MDSTTPTSSPQIKVIVLDMGGVIVEDVVYASPQKMGLESIVSPDILPSFSLIAEDCMKEFKLGNISEVEFWTLYTQRLHIQDLVSIPTLQARIRALFSCFNPTLDLMDRLHSRGYTLAILSNHTQEWFNELMDRFSLHRFFPNPNLVVASCHQDIRAAKPSHDVYRKLLARICSVPGLEDTTFENLVFIDDKKRNTDAAALLGIHGIPYDSRKNTIPELEAALQALNVDI